MKQYEIWGEGYLCTGMEGMPEPAHYWGAKEAETFKEACIKLFSEDERDMWYFNEETLTYWGCRLFDNESDARKAFG